MKTDPVKVLIVGADRGAGGVPQYVQTLEHFANRQAVELRVVVSGNKAPPGVPRFETLIKHVCPFKYSLLSLPLRVLRLRRLLNRHSVAVMHLHTARAGLVGCLAAMSSPVAVVYTGHGWRFEQKSSRLARALFYVFERYICSQASVVTFLTGGEKELGVRKKLLTPDKAVVIPTNICIEPFTAQNTAEVARERSALGIPQEASVIGMVGRLDKGKDPTTFLLTAARVLARVPNAYFLWVGDGPLRSATEALASQLDITDRFIITGGRPHSAIPALLKTMNVFLFPSRGEAFSLALLEAQASRTPIVTASFPGVDEVIQHNVTGCIFPIGNADQASSCIELLLTDGDTRRRIVAAAYDQVVTKHSQPSSMARRFEELYTRFARRTQYTSRSAVDEIHPAT